ncbi:MAG: hypothetical protein Kow0069_19850 [Promethearchaeota archaeon]
MVAIGLFGPQGAGKTLLLRELVKFVRTGGYPGFEVLTENFSGESVVAGDEGTKTIHPNRVVLKDVKTGRVHCVFAPSGRESPVARMGRIAVRRLARAVVLVFDATRPVEEQIDQFDVPASRGGGVFLVLNKMDALAEERRSELGARVRSELERALGRRGVEVEASFKVSGRVQAGLARSNEKFFCALLESCRRL